MKNFGQIWVWLILAGLFALIFFGAKGYWSYLQSPVDAGASPKAFVVARGESVTSVGERLESEGLIRSAFVFRLVFKTKKAKLEAGSFKLSASQPLPEIIDSLGRGVIDKWVTLLEGWRVEEMAEKLDQELGINKQEFLKIAKEGYMFPDSYLFGKEASVADIASMMRTNFDKKYSAQLRAKVKKLGLSEEEGVILASIVEREGRSSGVRQKVASILLKRWKIGMGLNADATIQYALGYQEKEKGWWKRHLTLDDLKFESAYNTYLYRGLPPAAIANPSLSSLEAVTDADVSIPYLYYYHDSKGNSHYAKTLEEHNFNVTNSP